MLWMSKRRLGNILCLLRAKTHVFLTSFVRYECLKDASETSKKRPNQYKGYKTTTTNQTPQINNKKKNEKKRKQAKLKTCPAVGDRMEKLSKKKKKKKNRSSSNQLLTDDQKDDQGAEKSKVNEEKRKKKSKFDKEDKTKGLLLHIQISLLSKKRKVERREEREIVISENF